MSTNKVLPLSSSGRRGKGENRRSLTMAPGLPERCNTQLGGRGGQRQKKAEHKSGGRKRHPRKEWDGQRREGVSIGTPPLQDRRGCHTSPEDTIQMRARQHRRKTPRKKRGGRGGAKRSGRGGTRWAPRTYWNSSSELRRVVFSL